MTDYQFDACLVADEATFVRMPNAQVTVYDIADASNSTPLTLKDLNGLPLPNPMFSTADAFIPAFSTTVPQVKLVAGSFAIPHSSFKSLLDQATAAKTFVQGIGVLTTTTGPAGTSASATMDENGKLSFTIPQGAQGPQGLPGPSSVPADTAVGGYVNSAGSATRAALDAVYRAKSLQPVNAKEYGAKGDGSTDDTAALQAFINYCIVNHRAGIIPAGTYKITSTLNFDYKNSWSIRGEGAGVTRIKQFTNNIPVLELGTNVVAGDYMHSFSLGGFTLDYNTAQTGNTSANDILLSQMAYQGQFTDINFDRGYYGMKVASGIGGPWGCTFDDLRFGGAMSAGAMDWSQCINAVPNNRFGRMFVTGTNMTGSPGLAIFDVRGYNFLIDTIEFIDIQGSKALLRLAAGSRCDIGTLKIENGTYNTANTVYLVDVGNGASAWCSIGHFTVSGNNMVVTNNTTVYAIRNSGEGVECDLLDIGTTAAIPGGSALYAVSASNTLVTLGHVKSWSGNWTGLQNNGSSVSGNFVTVRSQLNHRLSDDKGDADYTVALGDPNVVAYQTPLTAPRTITLPSDGTKLFNGLYFEVAVDGAAPTSTNSLTVKSSTKTLATITSDKTILRFTWRRNTTAQNGWVVTKSDGVRKGDLAINVRDYGAVGDGVADDTAAIQAALNAVPVGGKSVFLPAGKYKVTSTLTVTQDGTTIYGEGTGNRTGATQDSRGSRIEAAGAITGAILQVQRAANDRPLQGITLRDFTVDGGLVGTGVDGIVFRVNQGHMDRVHVWKTSGVGLRVLGYASPAWDTYDTTFNNLIIGYCTGSGVLLDTKSADTHWSHCIFLNNQDNFVSTGGASMQVTGCHFYTPTAKNIFLNGSGARSKFANCKIEGASDHQFVIDTTNGGYSDIQITGCGFSSLNQSIADNTFDHILVLGPSGNGVSRTLIVGNSFNLKGGSTVKARYAINLSTSAAQNTVIVANSFGPASHWGTTALNNGTNSTLTTFVKGNFGLADITQVNVQTASYTAALTDADGVIEMNSASAVTVTIPTVATAQWIKGNVLTITQVGAGQVTIAGAAGVTLRTPRTLTTRAQWSTVRLRMRASNEWVLEGDLT